MMSEDQYVQCVEVQSEPPHPVPARWQIAVDALVKWYDAYASAYLQELTERDVEKPRLAGYATHTGRVILHNLAQSCTPAEAQVKRFVGVLTGYRHLAERVTDDGRYQVIRKWPHDIYDQLQQLLDGNGDA